MKKRVFVLVAGLILSMVLGCVLPGCTPSSQTEVPGGDPPNDPGAGNDDPSDNTTPETEKGVDVVLFIGQSNMAGRGDASIATQVQEGHAYEFRAISDPTKLYHLEEPFGVKENNPTSGVDEDKKTGSMVSAFCEAYYAATNTPIVAVSCSVGGRKISFFDTNGKPYEDACNRVRSAQDFLIQLYEETGNDEFKIKNTYVVWLQGESDGDSATTAENYTATLDRIVKGFKEDIGCEQTFIIPIGTFNSSSTIVKENYTTIRNAQIAYCESSEDATVISNTVLLQLHADGYMKDAFHFKQEGYEILGADAGAGMASFVKSKETPA